MFIRMESNLKLLKQRYDKMYGYHMYADLRYIYHGLAVDISSCNRKLRIIILGVLVCIFSLIMGLRGLIPASIKYFPREDGSRYIA